VKPNLLPGTALPQLRLIIMAMMTGVVTLGAVAVYIGQNAKPDLEQAKLLLIALAALCIMEIPAFILIGRVMIGKLQVDFQKLPDDQDPWDQLLPSFFTITLIRGAMVEGASIFGCVIMLISGVWLSLIVPMLGLMVLSLLFPTDNRFHEFIGTVTGRRRLR
jgi:hypothetical protein